MDFLWEFFELNEFTTFSTNRVRKFPLITVNTLVKFKMAPDSELFIQSQNYGYLIIYGCHIWFHILTPSLHNLRRWNNLKHCEHYSILLIMFLAIVTILLSLQLFTLTGNFIWMIVMILILKELTTCRSNSCYTRNMRNFPQHSDYSS